MRKPVAAVGRFTPGGGVTSRASERERAAGVVRVRRGTLPLCLCDSCCAVMPQRLAFRPGARRRLVDGKTAEATKEER